MEKQTINEEHKKAMLVNTETFVDIAESVNDADSVIEAFPKIMNLMGKFYGRGQNSIFRESY